jgi:hypothetical protein
MNISYGICVGPDFDAAQLTSLVGSIIFNQPNEADFEIIMVGDIEKLADYIGVSHVRIIPFDENEKPGWITKKKNRIVAEASNDVVCITHDYHFFENGWLTGVNKFSRETEWDVLQCHINTFEGTRHSDWMVNPRRMQEVIDRDPEVFVPMLMEAAPHENGPQFVNGLPYDVSDLSHIQYISGGFILCRKQILEENPLSEDMIWGDPPGEDIVWSEQLNEKGIKFHFNPEGVVRLQRPKKWQVSQMPDEFVEALRDFYGSKPI